MTQKIFSVEVPKPGEQAEETVQAGNMFEHNATQLQFNLDEVYLQGDYRFYAEFVTVKGVARTAYLSPVNGVITVSLPLEITAQMTAMCVLNVVQISADGKTEQLIKAKKVRLYFSDLENTDRLIDENHAFSVNQLLEAIQKNTFKGDKGDKGDAYILTDGDRTEIAEQIQEDLYGLPLCMTFTARGDTTLRGAQENGDVSALTVSPESFSADGVPDIKVTVGENAIKWLLSPEKYAAFPPPESNYSNLELTLKPNTAYAFSKLNDTMAKGAYSAIVANGTTIYFCHKNSEASNRKYFEFTTDASGSVTLRSTVVSSSESIYATVLESDWLGISVTELANSVILQRHFDTPLYFVSPSFADSFDFISGILTRRTAKTVLQKVNLSAETPIAVSDGGKTAYRYVFTLPSGSKPRISGVYTGRCAAYAVMDTDVTDNAAYAKYVTATGEREGIYFGSADGTVCVLSESAPAAFSEQLSVTPLEIVYAVAESVEQLPAAGVVMPPHTNAVSISPRTVRAELTCKADISAAMSNLQARLTDLENKL